MTVTRVECRVLEAGPLSAKGVEAVVDCRLPETDRVTVRGVLQARELLSSLLPLAGLGAVEAVFSENESIGDRFMLYKFSLEKGAVKVGSARLITDAFKPIRLVITLGHPST